MGGKSKMIRTTMSVLGMILSYTCGIGFLGGIAGTLDSIGHIMGDVADGIGFVSKAIDVVESFFDPSSTKKTAEEVPELSLEAPAIDKPTPVLCKKGNCVPYDPTKDRVLQQKLIELERQKILSGVEPLTTPTPLTPEPIKMGSPPKTKPYVNNNNYKGKRSPPSSPKGRRYRRNEDEEEEDEED
ncbi:uncharacterized protein [Lepeophtheirus salmonis]|nr:uncharacterized protein LOC121126283 [Lepeophtheirus salmonis]